MANYAVKCEAIEVRGENGVCIGPARCKKGEVYTLGARTPTPAGMCGMSFAAINPIVFAMRRNERMEFEKNDYVDLTCPDGCVTYRLSRIKNS
jgi:uncharacterized repeat protein (TIGR04076 family)